MTKQVSPYLCLTSVYKSEMLQARQKRTFVCITQTSGWTGMIPVHILRPEYDVDGYRASMKSASKHPVCWFLRSGASKVVQNCNYRVNWFCFAEYSSSFSLFTMTAGHFKVSLWLLAHLSNTKLPILSIVRESLAPVFLILTVSLKLTWA